MRIAAFSLANVPDKVFAVAVSPATRRAFLTWFVAWTSTSSCALGPSQPSTTEADPAVVLDLALVRVEPVAWHPSADVRRELADMVDRAPSFLEGAMLWRGEIEVEGMADSPTVWIAAVAPPSLDPMRVWVAVDEQGTVRRVAARGTEVLDVDPDRRWQQFCKRLQRSASDYADTTLAYADVEPALRRIEQRSAEDGRLARLLTRIRVGMSRISMFVEHLSGRLDVQQKPPASWLDPAVADMEVLAASADVLTSTLGAEGAEQIVEQARAARAAFTAWREAIERGSADEVRAIVRDHIRAGLCSDCHRGESTAPPRTRQRFLSARGDELGIPRGMMCPPFDTPIALGDDGRMSRDLAAAARSGVLLIDTVRRAR